MIHAVADASVAVKWFLPPTEAERGHDRAVVFLQGVRSGQVELLAPDRTRVTADERDYRSVVGIRSENVNQFVNGLLLW